MNVHTTKGHFFIQFNQEPTIKEFAILEQLLGIPIVVPKQQQQDIIVPKAHIQTSWCTNALNILYKQGVTSVDRIEQLRKYDNHNKNVDLLMESIIPEHKIISYFTTTTNNNNDNDNDVFHVKDIQKFSHDQQLGFDKHDIKWYNKYFKSYNQIPTNMELISLGMYTSHTIIYLF